MSTRTPEDELSTVDGAVRQAEHARMEGDLPTAVRHLAIACVPSPPRAPQARAVLADAVGDLLVEGGDLDGADLARTVASAPDDPDACFDLGYRLMHHGLAHLAEAFLAPAAMARRDAVPVWLEYLAALDRIGRHDRALEVTDANPTLVERSAAVRYFRAFHALLTARIDLVRQLVPTLDDPVDDVVVAGRHRLEAVLARADAIGPHAPLDREDLRGWHMALNGGLLLTLADEGEDVMRGRWAMVAPSAEMVCGMLDAAATLLDALGDPVQRVLVIPDRDSQIVAHVAARRLDVPVEPWSPDAEGLIVVWDPDELDAPTIARLQRHRPGQRLLACSVRWTEVPPFAPDLVGWLHQILLAPWNGALRKDPETGDVHRLPSDARPVEAIAAELARAEVAKDPTATKRLRALADACRGLPEPALPGVFRDGGLRPLLWEGAPVHSARFL